MYINYNFFKYVYIYEMYISLKVKQSSDYSTL